MGHACMQVYQVWPGRRACMSEVSGAGHEACVHVGIPGLAWEEGMCMYITDISQARGGGDASVNCPCWA